MLEPGILTVVCGALAGLLAGLAAIEAIQATPGAADWTSRAFEPLRRAGSEGYLPSRPERRRLALAATLAAALIGGFFLGDAVGLLAAATAPMLALRVVVMRRRRYRRQLEAALPEVANAIADSLAAGRSLRGALADVAAVSDDSAATEFSALATELELGVPTGMAIRQLGERAGSARVDAFVAAILGGREAGGDLADLLRRFAAGAEAQARAAREARGATAQARFTGLLVATMPLGGALFAELVQRGFLAGLFASPISVAMLLVALILQGLGFMVIRRLARDPA